jgi:hypothetical protein
MTPEYRAYPRLAGELYSYHRRVQTKVLTYRPRERVFQLQEASPSGAVRWRRWRQIFSEAEIGAKEIGGKYSLRPDVASVISSDKRRFFDIIDRVCSCFLRTRLSLLRDQSNRA